MPRRQPHPDSNVATRHYPIDFSKGHNKGSPGKPVRHFLSPSRDLLRISGPSYWQPPTVYSPGERSGETWKETLPDPIDTRQTQRTGQGRTRSVDTWDLMDLVSQYGELEKFYDAPDRMDESIYSGAMVLRKAQEQGKLVPGLRPDQLPEPEVRMDTEVTQPIPLHQRQMTDRDRFEMGMRLFVHQMTALRLDLQRHKAQENPRRTRIFPARAIPAAGAAPYGPGTPIVQLVPYDPTRHRLIITNVGGANPALINTTKEALLTFSGITLASAGPNMQYVIEDSDAYWIMSVAGTTIDIVETRYEDEFRWVGTVDDEDWERKRGVDIEKTEFRRPVDGSSPFPYMRPSLLPGSDEPGEGVLPDDDWPTVALRRGTSVLVE